MTRSNKSILMAAIALGATLVVTDVANAGGGCSSGRCSRGGGYYGAPSYGYRAPTYYQPTYPQQVYQQQPGLIQTGIQQQLPGGLNQQQIGQTQPGSPQPNQSAVLPPGTPTLRSNVNSGQPQSNPALANSSNATAAPAASQNQTAANPPASTTAQMSALQALGGFAPPEEQASTTPAQPRQAEHIGNWSATLSNGSVVQLALQADGTFSWTATNKSGKSSSFQGTYAVGNGALTLVRSTDNQKLAGSMTNSSDGSFSFKLNGSDNAATLNFARS